MISEGELETDFSTFRDIAEKGSLEVQCASLLSSAGLYGEAGLANAALSLYKDLDTPKNLGRLADFDRNSTLLPTSYTIEIDPHRMRDHDPLTARILETFMMGGNEYDPEGGQPSTNIDKPSFDDSYWKTQVEVKIANRRAFLHLSLGQVNEALTQADRLSEYEDSHEAQYTAAAIYSSQGMRDRSLASLERLAKLRFDGLFPDQMHFESVRNEQVFRDLQAAGSIDIELFDPLPIVHVDAGQLSILIKRARQEAHTDYISTLVDLFTEYAEQNADWGNYENAHDAANEVIVRVGMNGTTTGLLGYVYNRFGKHGDALQVLIPMEKSLSASGTLELALALTIDGQYSNAFERLDRAFTLDPSLYELVKQEQIFSPLKQLESQPSYHMLMTRTNAVANAGQHIN